MKMNSNSICSECGDVTYTNNSKLRTNEADNRFIVIKVKITRENGIENVSYRIPDLRRK
jgi:hypothetical protein